MVINLILMPSKLVNISKNAGLWRNFYYVTLLNSHFCMGDLLQICCVFAEHLSWTTSMEAAFGHLRYNKKQGKQRYID